MKLFSIFKKKFDFTSLTRHLKALEKADFGEWQQGRFRYSTRVTHLMSDVQYFIEENKVKPIRHQLILKKYKVSFIDQVPISALSDLELLSLLMAHVQTEKSSEGHFLSMLEAGLIQAILEEMETRSQY